MTLIVNPNNRLRTNLAAIEPPLWSGLTSSYLHADILDAEALDLTLDETEQRIRELHPESVIIVVMGNNPSVSSTPKMPVAEALAERIEDLDVSLTGIHPIAVGSRFKVIKTPFHGCPDMPFDLLPMDRYRAHNWHCFDGSPRMPYASVYTSLGCPFDCYYCPIHTLYNGRRVRFRPVDNILREIDTLVTKYKVRNIKFWDELFSLKEDRVTAICSGLKGYKLNIWAYARLDTITEKMLKAMKDGGITWLGCGFENMDDGKVTAGIEGVIKGIRDAGINIAANFMFGLPEDTPKSVRATLDFAKKHLFEYVNFYVARPYPGSQWYADLKLKDVEWEDFNQYGKNRLPFRDMAFKEYFTNPDYLSMMELKFGEQGVNQIHTMLSWDGHNDKGAKSVI